MTATWLSESGDDLLIDVKVIPKAGRDQLAGERDGRLLVRVTAAPDGGKANAAVCGLIAKRLGVPRSRVEVKSGPASRSNTIRVIGMSAAAAETAIA